MNDTFRLIKWMQVVALSWLVLFSIPCLTNQQRADAADDQTPISAIREIGGIVKVISDRRGDKGDEWEVEFHLRGRGLTDEGLAHIADLKQIVSLNLRDTKITSHGLVHLQGLTRLRTLHLERTKVGDQGIAYLAKLKNLEYLNLYSTNISDKSLENLNGLTNLRKLYLWQTKVTDAGVTRLQQQLPELRIVRGVDLDKLPKYEEIIARKLQPKGNLEWIAVSQVSEAPRSKNGNNTQVLFENKSGKRVKLYWVSYGNELKLYVTLDPNATREQNSYARNTWLIMDENDSPLGYFIVTDEVSRAVIPSL